MLRNEADVVEAFVRHNLGLLDRLVVIDHGSVDRSATILAALVAEGLPLSVIGDDTLAFRQGERLTRAVRAAAADADWIFCLDADEFLLAQDRAALERALAAAGPPLASTCWTLYVPESCGSTASHPFQRAPLRVEMPRPSLAKVVVAAALAERPDWMLAPGSHHVGIADGGSWREMQAKPLADVNLAHLPFRSPAQFLAKVTTGWLSHRLAYGPEAELAPVNAHWRALYRAWRDGGEVPDWATLQRLALDWYALAPAPNTPALPREAARLVPGPLPAPPLRYTTTADADPLRLLAAWSERLVAMLKPSR